MANKMVRGQWNIVMVTHMMDIGKMVKNVVEEYLILKVVNNMMENGNMMKETVKVKTHGQVDSFTMEIG